MSTIFNNEIQMITIHEMMSMMIDMINIVQNDDV